VTDIKICGTRTLEGATQAVACGAEYVGFIFAPARRYVPPPVVARMLASLPGRSSIRAAGVFVDEPISHVLEVARVCGLDLVQLHGAEPPEYAAEIARHLPVVKAFRLCAPEDLVEMRRYHVDGYLVEPRVAGQMGGAGVPLDWHAIRDTGTGGQRLILSGGLRPDNVAEAIAMVHPSGVDVSSGVESGGIQDLDKIAAFIAAVRATDRNEVGSGSHVHAHAHP